MTIHASVFDSTQSGDESPSQPAASGWGHGLQLAALKLDDGKLGDAASRAVRRWPPAQKADPTWEWERVLIFLVQTALIVQGHDPGKPDGLIGPNTMLALLAWDKEIGGPSWASLAPTVVSLLHGTLKAQGLSPGPIGRFLGPQSVEVLEPWVDEFFLGAMLMAEGENGPETARKYIMERFGQTPSSDVQNPPPRAASGVHGSIAFSQEADGGYAWGIAWSFDDAAGARNTALGQCRAHGGTGCTEVGWFREACGALAIGDNNGYGTGWGATTAEAERSALEQCRVVNADCRVEVARCSHSKETGGEGVRRDRSSCDRLFYLSNMTTHRYEWHGPCADGKPTGTGTFTSPHSNGEGTMRDGKPNGWFKVYSDSTPGSRDWLYEWFYEDGGNVRGRTVRPDGSVFTFEY